MKHLITIIILSILLSLSDTALSQNWLTGWKYRTPIYLTGHNKALNNYQVLVIMDTRSLINSLKMKYDAQDLRFTDGDGTTMLDYWIEGGINTDSTKIWVEVPEISMTKDSIYVYYFNANAFDSGNAKKTFIFYDDASQDLRSEYSFETSLHPFTSGNLAYDQANNRYEVNGLGVADKAALILDNIQLNSFAIHVRVLMATSHSSNNVQMGTAKIKPNDFGYSARAVLFDQSGSKPRLKNTWYTFGWHDISSEDGGIDAETGLFLKEHTWYTLVGKYDSNYVEADISRSSGDHLIARIDTTDSRIEGSGHPAIFSRQTPGTDTRYFKNVWVRNYSHPEPVAGLGQENEFKPSGIAERQEMNQWMVYPNPSQGDFRIRFAENGHYRISLLSVHGQLIRQIIIDGSQVEISVGELNPGVYLIQAEDGQQGTDIKRLIIY